LEKGNPYRLPGGAAFEVAVAVLALSLGTLVYLTIRAPGEGFLIPYGASTPLLSTGSPWLGALAGAFPTFAHTLAFALLTAALVLPGPRGAAVACGLWLGLEALLEAGQAAPVAARIVGLIPPWFARVPVLDHAGAYFTRGTFDPLDLAAAVLGAAAAYLILRRIPGEGTCNAT